MRAERRGKRSAPIRDLARRLALVSAPLTVLAGGCADGGGTSRAVPAGGAAELVLRGGRIVTLEEAQPKASALAAGGGRILAIGDDDEIDAYLGPDTEVIDLDGRLVIPGFIEGHGHFMSLGDSRLILDLMSVRSWDEIVGMVAEVAGTAAPGEWIRGRGWHQEKWDDVPEPNVDEVPLHEGLSAVSPDNPVLLGHASGHAAFANAKALELAEIDRDTPDPPGGTIVRDDEGNATGLLRETAQRLVSRVMVSQRAARPADAQEQERREAARLAFEELLAKGITSFHDAGASFDGVDFFRQLADEGGLPVRLYVMLRPSIGVVGFPGARDAETAGAGALTREELAGKLAEYRMVNYGDGRLTVRSIKRQVDGALGSHGAWLLEPYSDMPETAGLVLEPLEAIRATAELALEQDYQLNTHAIGDRGNREVLDLYADLYAAARGENPDADLRWRIEHSQHVHPDDLPRFAELGVIPSMQAIHGCSDAPWVPERLGLERAAANGYMWRALAESGAVVTNGTDAPVEDVDPIASYYCTVARLLPDGSVFFEGQPDQRLGRLEALRTYTINNAYAAFEEDQKGSLKPGKYADIVVLSRDILEVPEEEIPGARVLYTIVGGEVKYRAAE